MNHLHAIFNKYNVIFRLLFLIVIFVSVAFLATRINYSSSTPPIKVGILYSESGPLSSSEAPIIKSLLLAIDEINQNGGVLGSLLEAIIADAKSDLSTFAREAENLIQVKKVDVVFGCWTSASRKIVKPIFEKYNHLLVYPLQYEGLEESSNIVYTGANPNQQIIPATIWCMNTLGKKIFLVGSDYIYPRSVNEILKTLISNLGGQVVGEEYVILGTEYVAPIIKKIEEANPDVIINTLNGTIDNSAFFYELQSLAKKKGKIIPTMSTSITTQELDSMGIDYFKGHYLTWNYFQTIDSAQNTKFVKKFRSTYGKQQRVNDPMEAAYFGMYVWKNIIEEIQTANTQKVVKALRKKYICYLAPEGFISLNRNSLLAWKTVRIAQINKEGKAAIVWTSLNPIKPEPYPNDLLLFKYFSDNKTQDQWNQYLNDLYKKWGNQWQAK